MMKIDVVIGANFGDEGKGLVTSWLTERSDSRPVVVRFNGGAQAGHTVELADGRRHVFHHFGAGTLQGASTYLSKYFIVNPILLLQEQQQLANLGIKYSNVYADRDAQITTPYDMLINQFVEQKRQHGSCGIGINETVDRSRHKQFSWVVGDLFAASSIQQIKHKLENIRDRYVPQRLQQLQIQLTPQQEQTLFDPKLFDSFIDVAYDFTYAVICSSEKHLFNQLNRNRLIFEGAQGLLLDEHHKFFPHVTRSRPGLPNVVEMLKRSAGELSVETDVYYTTRSYLTRHGNGPMPNELPHQPFDVSYKDATNIDHDFQGVLRYGYLNVDLLREAIGDTLSSGCGGDIHNLPRSMRAKTHLVVSHFNYVENDWWPIVSYSDVLHETQNNALEILKKSLPVDDVLVSTSSITSADNVQGV